MEGEGKGRDESMRRHTRQVMHLSPRQGNWVGCAIILTEGQRGAHVHGVRIGWSWVSAGV
jgi:hypothetical protein